MRLSFLLKGEVQGVKMRRYIESAGQHFGVSGYVINIDDDDPFDPGAVFGQAWVVERDTTGSDMHEGTTYSDLDSFERWIRGEWTPQSYTNIKPTPIGTAYPEKAKVECYALSKRDSEQTQKNLAGAFSFDQFTMVREDDHAMEISKATAEDRRVLSLALASGCIGNSVAIGSWPQRS